MDGGLAEDSGCGHEQVLEEGQEFCSSESEGEYSDHGEKWADETMYTPDMMDAKGKPDLSKARLATEQANALRAAKMAGGHATVQGKG
jgi:hypothetical protein